MYKRKFLTYVVVVLCFLCQNMNVCAGNATPITIKGDVYTWTESLDVQVETSSDKGIHVTGTALHSEEFYHYATISAMFEGAYERCVYDKEYAAITIEVDNPTTIPYSLNFSLIDKDSNQLVMKEDAYVLREVQGIKTAEKVTFSSFLVEGGFQGKVTIPLSMLEESDKNTGDFQFEDLTSWSVSILMEGNHTAELYIKGLAWQPQDFLKQYEKSFGTYIEGAERVQIPEHGESISFYQLVSEKEQNYQFVTEALPQGVLMDKEGKLTLDTTVGEQELLIQAMDEEGVVICKKVSLVNSWRKMDTKSFFYGPEDLEEMEYPFDEVKESYIVAVRWILLAGCILVFLSYLVFYGRYKRDKEREEK